MIAEFSTAYPRSINFPWRTRRGTLTSLKEDQTHMKGYGIYVKNDLLEPKHVAAMGEAVWLYLWMLDRMTSITEGGIGRVLHGTPVRHTTVQSDLGISRTTYARWIDKLRHSGYIETRRSRDGLVIHVAKAKKVFGNNRDVSHVDTDVPDPKHLDVPDVKHPYKRQNRGDKTVTKQLAAKPPGHRAEVVKVLDAWAELGWQPVSDNKKQWFPASRLVKKHGAEKTIKALGVARSFWGRAYKPQVNCILDLEQKMNALVSAWAAERDEAQPRKRPPKKAVHIK